MHLYFVLFSPICLPCDSPLHQTLPRILMAIPKKPCVKLPQSMHRIASIHGPIFLNPCQYFTSYFRLCRGGSCTRPPCVLNHSSVCRGDPRGRPHHSAIAESKSPRSGRQIIAHGASRGKRHHAPIEPTEWATRHNDWNAIVSRATARVAPTMCAPPMFRAGFRRCIPRNDSSSAHSVPVFVEIAFKKCRIFERIMKQTLRSLAFQLQVVQIFFPTFQPYFVSKINCFITANQTTRLALPY